MVTPITAISHTLHLNTEPKVHSIEQPTPLWRRALRVVLAGFAQTPTPQILWLPGMRPWYGYGSFLSRTSSPIHPPQHRPVPSQSDPCT